MTTFDVMIDDFGRIELPEIVTDILNANEPGDSLTIGIELDETGEPIVTLATGTMKTEKPEIEEIYTFYDRYTDEIYRTIKITDEQNKFLDWLIDKGYIVDGVEINPGYPDVEDLTK